jgi:amino acid adenylation domain-containing protein
VESGVGAENLCYVLYTSGSTGEPKGVGFRHGGLSALVGWHLGELLGGVRTLGYASMSFDASFHEVFSALCSGGTVVVASEEERRDVRELGRLVREGGVEKATLPPVVLEQVAKEESGWWEWAGVREVTATGERLVVTPELRRLFGRLGGCRLENQMGPTETHVVVGWELEGEASSWEVLPGLGRPIAGSEVWVVDEELEPVARGVRGELCIGGAQLARGYVGEPGRTAERFLPDPWGPAGSRMYRSGDVCRWRADGQLEYLGRADEQVKVRGQRVELGEVEAVLREHPGVREAVAGVRGEGVERRLVAWVAGEVEWGELRGWLGERLPEAMVPQLWVEVEGLPLTASGKVDRRRLPEPEVVAGAEYRAPRSPAEEVLAGIWAEVLGAERVGVDDSFFDLGGQSLLAARAVARIRAALDVELPLRTLFEAPTVAALAGRLAAAPRRLPRIAPAPRQGPMPLSFAQRRLWFLDQLQPGLPVYNVAVAYRLRGELRVEALAAALDAVVARHEALRTTLPAEAGQPRQHVAPARPLGLVGEDLTAEADPEAAAWALAEAEARRPFDLAAGPLLRARLWGLGAAGHLLLLTAHHAVMDGWSQEVLERELSAVYAGQDLPALPVQYADYATWQRAVPLERELEHWRRRLAGVPALDLPGDPTAGPLPPQAGATHAFALPAGLAAAVRERARALGATPFMVLLAALAALLRRTTGAADVAVGTPVAGRQLLELEPLIGCFVNTLVLRCDVAGDPPFAELVGRVRETALEADAHQRLPFERLVEELRPDRDLGRNPLFQVMLVLQPAADHRLALPGLDVERRFVHTGTAKLDLTLSLQEAGDRLTGVLEYRRDRSRPETAAAIAGRYVELLGDAVARPRERVSRLRLLPAGERRRLAAWSDGEPPPAPARLHGGFQAWARRTPGAPALRMGGETLSYEALHERARRMARRLRRMGARPGDRVGIRLGPSMDQVTAVLGALLAGAAYVPLDPEYPPDRLDFMAADAGLAALVTDAGGLGGEPDGPPPEEAVPGGPCYVIYTSGSTGLPKGVVVAHRGAANAVADVIRRLRLGPGDRVLQVSSLSFDASVLELFGALGSGACLHLAARATVRDPARLAHLLRAEAITALIATPSLLAALDGSEGSLPDLRAMTLGAEPCPAELAARWSRGRRVWNLFAPTEASIYATAHELSPGVAESPPVGRPIPGARVWVLDEHLQPLPAGAAGEVCVGGAGVAIGYLGRPGLTAERFVPDPRSVGERLYRTGDLGRWRPDGELEFLGRRDQQVKVRGHRVELGEVEAALRTHPAVRDAVAALRLDRPGGRLVAYWVREAGAPAGAAELRAHLRRSLPEPMVPSALVELAALPLTATGKPDRRALPAPPPAGGVAEFEAPATEAERALAGLWAALLGTARVGRHDDFFELGGESLLAARLIARARAQLGLEASLRDLFEEPTVAGLARRARPAPPDPGPAAASERRRRVERLVAAAGELSDDELEAALRELEAR